MLIGIKLYGVSVTGRHSYVTDMVTYSYSVALAAIAGNESDSEARCNGYGKANNQVYRRIILLHCPWLQ